MVAVDLDISLAFPVTKVPPSAYRQAVPLAAEAFLEDKTLLAARALPLAIELEMTAPFSAERVHPLAHVVVLDTWTVVEGQQGYIPSFPTGKSDPVFAD